MLRGCSIVHKIVIKIVIEIARRGSNFHYAENRD